MLKLDRITLKIILYIEGVNNLYTQIFVYKLSTIFLSTLLCCHFFGENTRKRCDVLAFTRATTNWEGPGHEGLEDGESTSCRTARGRHNLEGSRPFVPASTAANTCTRGNANSVFWGTKGGFRPAQVKPDRVQFTQSPSFSDIDRKVSISNDAFCCLWRMHFYDPRSSKLRVGVGRFFKVVVVTID